MANIRLDRGVHVHEDGEHYTIVTSKVGDDSDFIAIYEDTRGNIGMRHYTTEEAADFFGMEVMNMLRDTMVQDIQDILTSKLFRT